MKNCLKCDKEFEPSKGLINYCSMKCRQGKNWTEEDNKKKSEACKRKLSEELIEEIKQFYFDVKNLQTTSKKFNINPSILKRYIDVPKRKKWDNVKEKNSYSVQLWRVRTKQKLVDYKGGKCICCDYNKYIGALEFHHIDPSKKDFAIGTGGKTRALEALKKEVDKCVLVCANCHREIHANLITI